MCSSDLAVYCQDKFNFAVSEAGVFTILNVIASGFASYFVGKLGDKMGHKAGMMVAYSAHFTAVDRKSTRLNSSH